MKNKKYLVWFCAIVIVALSMFGVYKLFGPKASNGSKAVVVEVVDDNGKLDSYSSKTDAEYLKDLMDELSKTTDFSYEGTTSDYGLYITSINGLEANYDKDGAYWSIYVNGNYGQYGADQQPVSDGDTYRFAYEKSN